MTKEEDPLAEIRQLVNEALHGHRFDAARQYLQATFDRIANKLGLSRTERISISLANAYRLACETEDQHLIQALEALLKPEDKS